MKSKTAKLICALLSILMISSICATPASASKLFIKSYVVGDGADRNKEFEYLSRMVYHCTVCDMPFPNYVEYDKHHGNPAVFDYGAHGLGGSWYTLDDTKRVKNPFENIGLEYLTTGSYDRDAYVIQVLEDLDQYEGVYYQVNSGEIQKVPVQLISDWTNLSKYGYTSGYFPAVYIEGLPTEKGTKTYLTFYYLQPGATLSDLDAFLSASDIIKPDTPTPDRTTGTLKPGATDNDPILAADALFAMGLFQGTGMDENHQPIYELDRAPTRSEAVTMLVRLLGREDDAQGGAWITPFTDLEKWAEPYVGWAYLNGLTAGTSATTYSGSETISASQYLTFVLRALGYESGVDFQWDRAWELSDKIGLTSGQYNATTTEFTRGDVATISFNALYCKLKGSDTALIDTH